MAYGSLLHETRRALHARIVAVIEGLHPGRPGEHVERLAHHALRGGLRDRAVGYLRQAGAKAAARSAHREAVAFFEQALEILQADGPPGAALGTTIDLVFDLRASLAPLGEFGRTLAHLRQAETRAELLGDRRRLGWVSAYLPQSYYTLGEQAAAIRSAERALEIGTALDDAPIQIVATFGLGQAHHVLGDYDDARRHLARAMAAVEGPLRGERWGMAGQVSVAARIWLAASLADVGSFAEALSCARDGLTIAEAAGRPWSTAGSYMTVGFVHLAQGYVDEAAPVLDRGIAFSREMDLTAWLPMLLCARGVAEARRGRLPEALGMLDEGIRHATTLRILSRHALRLTWLAEAYVLAGRFDEAAAAAREAHRLASEQREKGYAAGALRMLGEVAAHTGDAEAAAGHYRDALASAQLLGMRPLEALCRLGLGSVARRAGESGPAKEHLNAAATRLREMDMRYWLIQAEELLSRL